MKRIEMNCTRCGGAGWYKDGKKNFKRVSRWIEVKHNHTPSKRNNLWDYVQDENGYKPYQEQFNPDNGLYLDYFRYNGRNYALEQFWALGNPFYTAVSYSYKDENGKTAYLSGMYMDGDIYGRDLFYIECDECCERLRVYVED